MPQFGCLHVLLRQTPTGLQAIHPPLLRCLTLRIAARQGPGTREGAQGRERKRGTEG